MYRFDRKTPPYMTPFERAKVLAFRAGELGLGQPPAVDPEGEIDPLKIAALELKAGKLGHLSIARDAPGGGTELWTVRELIVLDD